MKSQRDRIVDAVLEKAESGETLFLEGRPVPGFVSSQSIELDDLIGRPGVPLGRITEVKGWSGSGKSMLCCHLISEVQRMGGTAVLIDTERSYTSDWASRMGVDTSQVLDVVEELGVNSIESALRAIHIVLDAIDEKDEEPVVIIVDSLSALATESELSGDYDDNQPGVHAKLMSKAMRKMTKDAFSKKVALVFVGQLRDKVMTMGYGKPTSTLGGHAIFFHCALSIEMKRISAIRQGDREIGMETRFKIMKNKLGGVPFREGVIPFYYDKGFDNVMSLLKVAEKNGYVVKKGGWYKFVGDEEGKSFREADWPDIADDDLINKIKSEVFPDDQGV